jgi:hypothetical protein
VQTRAWLEEERWPSEEETLPKRAVTLPSGEVLEVGLYRSDDEDATNIFVFSGGENVLQVLASGQPQLVFKSPGGSIVSIAIYPE